jgi:hypothetical protein
VGTMVSFFIQAKNLTIKQCELWGLELDCSGSEPMLKILEIKEVD